MRTFRIAMVQMNPTVGDLDGNVRRITAWLREAKKAKADLVAFPELAITGYPPEDLLLKPRFVADNRRGLQEIVRHCRGLAAVVGYVSENDGHPSETGSLVGGVGRRARTLQCGGGHRRSEAHHDLLQVVPAELRRVRREPLFSSRPAAAAHSSARHGSRGQHL